MKVAVIGPGAMGCLFAGLFSEGGHEVWLLDNTPVRAVTLATEGLRLEGIGGTRRVLVQVATDPDAVGRVDLVLVWVKAYDTSTVSAILPELLGEDTWVVSLQNGLGNLETLSAVVDPGRLLGGATAYGATLVSEGVSCHTGTGDTAIGAVEGTPPDGIELVIEAFRDAGIEVTVAPNLDCVLWSKLLVNATINPLTALTRLKNGELLTSPDTMRLVHAVGTECESVASAAGIKLSYDRLEDRVRYVCEVTARNRSSMLQDVLKGGRTEIDAINGSVLRKAREVGAQASLNEMLVGLVKATEGGPAAEG